MSMITGKTTMAGWDYGHPITSPPIDITKLILGGTVIIKLGEKELILDLGEKEVVVK